MTPRYAFARKAVTVADKRARACNLIAYCTPERFALLTADDVARHSGLRLAEAETLLVEARGRRGG